MLVLLSPLFDGGVDDDGDDGILHESFSLKSLPLSLKRNLRFYDVIYVFTTTFKILSLQIDIRYNLTLQHETFKLFL